MNPDPSIKPLARCLQMRRLLVTIVAICAGATISLFTLTTAAFADPAQLVSGPIRPQVNGWYTAHPTVSVQAVCNGSPYGNTFNVDIAGWSWSGGGPTPEQAQPGKHYVELLSNDNSNIYINSDGTLSPYLAGGCSNPNGSTPTTVLWQGYIQWDNTTPTVSITSPSNNTNVADATIQISGNVSDDASGVESVTLNGVNTVISGSTWTVNMPLNMGLNSFQATATSNSGQQGQSASVTVFRYENPSSSNANSTNATPTTTTPSSSSKAAGQNSTESTTNNATTPTNLSQASDPEKSSSISTPVKVAASAGGAGAVGVATASFFGYIPYKRVGLFVGKLLIK